MASKLNKKFIAILGGSLLAACIGIAAIAFFILAGDADRAYKNAMEQEQQGNLDDALSYIGRAIGKDPSNQSYYDDYGRILLKIVPESEAEAVERYQRQYLPLMEKRTNIFQGDSEVWTELVEAYLERAYVFRNTFSWEAVVKSSGLMMEEFPKGTASNLYARDIRLLAMSKIYDLLTLNEQDEFEDMLEDAMAAENPSSVVWEVALKRRLDEATQYKNTNDKIRLSQSLSSEGNGFDALFERYSEGGASYLPGIREARIRRLLLMDTPPIDEIEAQKNLAFEYFIELTDRMIERGPDDMDPAELQELRSIYNSGILDPILARTRSLEMIEAGLLPLDLQLMYATTYITGDSVSACKVSGGIIAAPRESVGLMSIVQPLARRDASIVLFDSAFNEYTMGQASGELANVTLSDIEANAQIVKDQFSGVTGSDDIDLYIDGSLALLNGDMSLARAKLSELQDSNFINRTGIMNRFLPRLILAYKETGERGAATELLANYLEGLSPSDAPKLRLTYAVELLNMGRKAEGLIQLKGVLAADPENEAAQQLIARANSNEAVLGSLVRNNSTVADRSYQRIQNSVSEGRLDDALKMALALDEISGGDNTKNLVALLYFRLNRFEEARRALDEMADLEANVAAKQLRLLMTTDDPIERLRISSTVVHEDSASQNALFFSDLVRYAMANDVVEGDALIAEAFGEALSEISENRDVRRNLFGTTLLAESAGLGGLESGEMTQMALEAIRAVENDEVELTNTEAVFASRSGDYQRAVELLDPLIERGIASEESYLLQAMALQELGRNPEAIESMRIAFSKSPGNVYIIKRYAALLNDAGEQDRALEVLRNAVLAPVTRGLLLEQWLAIEADIGSPDVALAERRAIYQSDIRDSVGMAEPIINMTNAIQYAKLLMSVSPKRIYILGKDEKPRFTANAWAALSTVERRELLSECGEELRGQALRTLDDLEKGARNATEVRAIRLARAESFRMIDDEESMAAEIDSLLECCDADLLPTERLRVVAAASALENNEIAYAQLAKILESGDISAMRIATEAGLATGWSGVNELTQRIYESTGRPLDKVSALRLRLLDRDYESIRGEVDTLRATSDFTESVNLRTEVILLEAEIELGLALSLIGKYNDVLEAVGLATMNGDTTLLSAKKDEESTLRAQILTYFRKGIAIADEAIGIRPSDPRAYLRKHTMLQSLNELQHSESVQADMIENAQLGRDINPMNWPVNSNLLRAYAISGQGKNAMQVVDQYLRRGGSDPGALAAISQIARSERIPGLAVPPLKIAMEANPMDPAWPREIARLLLVAGDTKGAAEMWWNVIELDKSPEAIEAFIDLEFRQDKPNIRRLDELFKLAPDVINSRPVLLAAKALALSMQPGQRRRADRMMGDAYALANQRIEEGESSIVLDRMLIYFFMMNEDARSLKELGERLQLLIQGPLGAHELAGLASIAFDGTRLGGSDLESGSDYLQQAIDSVGSDLAYKKALMQQLSTVLYSIGRCGDGIKVLGELLEMGDEEASTLNNLAYMIIECENDPNKALRYSTRAIRNNRNVASYLDTHGYILFKIGDLEEAFRNLNRSVILQPSSSNLLNLAEVLEAQGKPQRAMVFLERLSREFPQLSESKQARANALVSRLR